MHRAIAVARVLLAIAMVTATFVELANYLVFWHRIGVRDLGLRTANFFTAFTFDVNLLGAAVLLVGAVLAWRLRIPEPQWYSALRLCLLAAILLVAVVYNAMLRALPTAPGEQVQWANEVLHVVAPAGIALDWLLAQHPRRVPLRAAGLVAIFPLAWVVFTLIRGGLVPDELSGTSYFYPYPFLNPHLAGGWIAVMQWIGALAVFTVVLGLLAVLAWRAEDRLLPRLPPLLAVEGSSGIPSIRTGKARAGKRSRTSAVVVVEGQPPPDPPGNPVLPG